MEVSFYGGTSVRWISLVGTEPNGKPFQIPRKPSEFMRNFRRNLHAHKDAHLPGVALACRLGAYFVRRIVCCRHRENFRTAGLVAGRQALMIWRKVDALASI